MEVPSPKKLITFMDYSKKLWILMPFSTKTKWSMLSELPKVKVCPVLSKDSVLDTCKKKPIEVSEKSDVSELGTLPELCIPLPELVNWVTTTELKSTKKFTESEKETKPTTPLLNKIWPIKPSLLWVVSLITVLLKTISLWSKDVVLDLKKESFNWENLWFLKFLELLKKKSLLNLSILPPNWDTEDSRLLKKKPNSSEEV